MKVLGEGGYGLGEFALRYPRDSKVGGVKGQTFVPEPDGSLRRVELERRSVVDGPVDGDTREVRFSMPALAPGAIFEFEYTYESEGLFSPPVWYFQSEEPTLASEFRFETPEFFDYMVFAQGERVERQPDANDTYESWRTTRYRWTARDVPALREEPFTTTEEDYAHKVVLQLRRVNPPDAIPKTVLGTWEETATALDRHDDFGRRLRAGRGARALAEGATGTAAERARAVYDAVRAGFVWDGRGGIFAARSLDDVAEARAGTAAEINLLLLTALREAGVEARPVLLSTRSNGRPIEIYPIVGQFDAVAVLVEADGALALLDATDPHRPYGTPPVGALSGAGWIADPDGPQWFAFDPPGGSLTSTTVQATLAPDGGLAGTLRLRLDGYDALAARTRLAEDEAESPAAASEAASEAADAPDGFDLTDVAVEGADDPYAPLTMRAAFASAADVVADEIYLSPSLVMRIDENPFQRATRVFPVDFAFPSTRSYIADIALPEGYAVEGVPGPVLLSVPSGAVTYRRAVQAENGRVTVRAVLTVARAQVPPAEYPALRALYDEVVVAEAEALVLTRTAAPPVPSRGGVGPEASAETAAEGGAEAGDQR